MPLNDITENTKDIKTQVNEMMKDSLAYYKLLAFKIATKSVAGLIKVFVVGLSCLLIVSFLCLAGAFALGEYWNNNAYGFLAVAGILILFLILFLALRKRVIDRPILENFSEILKDNES